MANNVSFPVIAVDDFGITATAGEAFTVEYTKVDYPHADSDDVAFLQEFGAWYRKRRNARSAVFLCL